jgi:hypothetical protein
LTRPDRPGWRTDARTLYRCPVGRGRSPLYLTTEGLPITRKGVSALRTPEGVLDAYGSWISSLAHWTVFATATHAIPTGTVGWDRVGVQRHRRLVREWFYDVVRDVDPEARWWSEMEFHASGQPHEHGMLATTMPFTARQYVRDVWTRHNGTMRFDSIESSAIGAARYVSKYAGKSAAHVPLIYGFGLLPRPSFSITDRRLS